MQSTGYYTFIIGLSIALALAVSLVLFWGGRIVIAIIQQARSTRRPTPQLQHPEFGILRLEGKLWNGKTQRDGKTISFLVAGSEAAPDAALIERLRIAINGIAELEKVAVQFLCKQEPIKREEDFSLLSVDFLWADRPTSFAMEFALAGDDDGFWRVQFENGRPTHAGRDD